jgi:hypothetical protein
MDFPLDPRSSCHCRPRAPVALWALIALIGIVLTVAAIAAAAVTDTRDFAARHGTVLGTRAL